MDQLICGVCGADWPVGEAFCSTCSSSAAMAEPKPVAAAPPPDPPHVPEEVPEEQPPPAPVPPAGACVRCGATSPRGSTRCLTCFAPLDDTGAELVIRFPWGARSMSEGQRLLVGRAPDSDIATQLARFPDVSRRHAELTVRDGRLVLRDVGSTNGTFLNGGAVPAGAEHHLSPGDSVRFGDRLVVDVGGGG